MAIDGHGTVQVGVIAFSDNSGDGLWDPREYIAYVPMDLRVRNCLCSCSTLQQPD